MRGDGAVARNGIGADHDDAAAGSAAAVDAVGAELDRALLRAVVGRSGAAAAAHDQARAIWQLEHAAESAVESEDVVPGVAALAARAAVATAAAAGVNGGAGEIGRAHV